MSCEARKTYATLEDILHRCRRNLSGNEEMLCESLLEDAAVIIDAYNQKASADAKRLVSCNMVIRILGNGESDAFQAPIGATQGSVSALGYSQSWTMQNGTTGEMYLSKLDKKLLGSGNRIGFLSPFSEGDGDA